MRSRDETGRRWKKEVERLSDGEKMQGLDVNNIKAYSLYKPTCMKVQLTRCINPGSAERRPTDVSETRGEERI